jgi:hypothetical protein
MPSACPGRGSAVPLRGYLPDFDCQISLDIHIKESFPKRQSILNLLQNFTGLEPLKRLFWSELNYDRANQPLSTRD